MKFTISQPIFKGLVSVLSSVTKEAKIVCTEDGMTTVCVDAAHVAMVGYTIPKDALTVEEWGDADIGMDLDKISAFFKTTNPDEDITVEIGDRFVLSCGNITRRMAIIDTSSMVSPKVPTLDPAVTVDIPMARLQSAIKGIVGLGDTVTMTVNGQQFKMATADETSSAEYELTTEEKGITIVGENASSMFPQDYIGNAVRAIPSSFAAKLKLGTDYPLGLDFTDGISTGWYLIAPRIEEGAE